MNCSKDSFLHTCCPRDKIVWETYQDILPRVIYLWDNAPLLAFPSEYLEEFSSEVYVSLYEWRVRHDWATELTNMNEYTFFLLKYMKHSLILIRVEDVLEINQLLSSKILTKSITKCYILFLLKYRCFNMLIYQVAQKICLI